MSREETIQVAGEKGVFDKYVGELGRIATGMGLKGQDREDVLQEVYLEAAKGPVEYGAEEEARRWLIRVTINRCLLEFRQRKRYRQKTEEILRWQGEQHNRQLEPGEELIRKEEVEAVQEGLRELKGELQGPLALKYFGGLNSSEIGEVLELKAGTVRKRLCQGRIMLAKKLREKGIRS